MAGLIHRSIRGSIFALLAFNAQAAGAAEVINFTNTGCQVGSSTFCEIPQTYADTDKIDVSYASINISTGARTPGLNRYGVGYGDLLGVVFGGRNQREFASELRFEAKQGFELSLLDFDFATFAGRSPTTPFLITDLAGTVLSQDVRSTGGQTHSNYAVNSPFGNGFIIRWGPDGYEVGLDNISYDARPLTSAVPEPGSWAMLIIGFGLAGIGLRSRSPASARSVA